MNVSGRRSSRSAPVGADGGWPVADGHAFLSSALAASHSASSASKSRSRRATPRAAAPPLDAREPPPELGVGGADGGLGLDPAAARDVDQHEQQVTELLGALGVVRGPAQLVGLLGDLVEHAVDRRPVVAEVGGPLLHLLAGGEGRHRRADPVERALDRGRRRAASAVTGSGRVRRGGCPLVGLDPLPLAVDVRGGPRDRVAEHVRMAPDDLRGDRGLDVGQVEDAGLGRKLGVEDDLQPQVAELAGQLGRGTGLERVVDLVGLLEEVLAQRRVGLLAVPRAAVGLRAAGPRSRASPTDRRRPAPAPPGAR